MLVEIKIPEAGESVTEVMLNSWHRAAGDYVEKDDSLCELETDKASMDLPAPESGVLAIDAEEGDELEVGAVIGTIDTDAKRPARQGKGGEERKQASPAEADEAEEKEEPSPPATPAPATAVAEAPDNGQSRATSVARKIAADRGIDLGAVTGTGPSGRITKSDVMAAVGSSDAEEDGTRPPSLERPARRLGDPRGTRREKMSMIRRRIAERLVAAQRTAAMLTTFNECDISAVMALRNQHKETFKERYDVNLGFMSFFVKAAVSALQTFPRVNAYIDGKEIEFHDYCDVSIAVGTDKGLVVPVLRNAEQMSFAEIETQIKDFATRARDGKLDIEEMTGGTFTITNGGIFGSLNSTPILNPPQSAILGMHAIKNRAVEDPNNPGNIVLRPMMYLAVSYDHRIIDGAEAVSFLAHIKGRIEAPERMLIGI